MSQNKKGLLALNKMSPNKSLKGLFLAGLFIGAALFSPSPASHAQENPLDPPAVPPAFDLRVGKGQGETPHVVVMGYEPWFGRFSHNNWTRPAGFDAFSILPLLRSAGMEIEVRRTDHWGQPQIFKVDGYDSSDPAVLTQHFLWLEAMGVDALLVDFSNRVQFYKSDLTVGPEFAMMNNIRAIYRELKATGSKLKVIPLLGAYERVDVDSGGLNQLLNDWYALMTTEYPGHAIIYEGKPLITIFHAVGTEFDSCGDTSCWQHTRNQLLKTRPSTAKTGNWLDYITLRHVGGLYDSQPSAWGETKLDARAINNKRDSTVTYWSWVDRFKSSLGYFPSFAKDSQGRVEAFTAANGSGGNTPEPVLEEEQKEKCYPTRRGWISCAWGRHPRFDGDKPYYAPDATLRVEDGVHTFSRYMHLAKELKPTFLIVNQWNQFEQTDEGFDYLTTHSLEPAHFGPGIDPFEPYNMARKEILAYREVVEGRSPANIGFKNISLRGISGDGESTLIGGFTAAGGLKRVLIRGLGPTLKKFGVDSFNTDPALTLYDGSKVIGSNESWANDIANHRDEAIQSNWGFTPDAKEALLTRTVKENGQYTVHLTGQSGPGKVGFLEIVDTDTSSSRLTSISGRAFIGQDAEILISGFTITGGARKVLIRGSGPSLARFGITGYLPDPKITLFRDQTVINSSDSWSTQANAEEILKTLSFISFPLDEKDGALLLVLEPGTYTVHLSGSDGQTGVGHIEASDLGAP
jgi:hypothetical protein